MHWGWRACTNDASRIELGISLRVLRGGLTVCLSEKLILIKWYGRYGWMDLRLYYCLDYYSALSGLLAYKCYSTLAELLACNCYSGYGLIFKRIMLVVIMFPQWIRHINGWS